MASTSLFSAIEVLNNLGIIAHQTDTVIGLGCLPNDKLLNRLQKLKLRPEYKSFILLASSLDQVKNFIQADQTELQKLTLISKKPTTWLVNASKGVPVSLLGDTGKIAIRITQHPDIKILCDHAGAIASTSANLSRQQICHDLNHVRTMFGPRIDYIQKDPTPGTGQSSTIIDSSSGKVLRQ